MTRTRRFLGGISVGYAYQLIVIVVGLWLTPFLLSRLGPYQFGLWLTATQLIAYLALLDIGVLSLLPRETAYATGRAAGAVDAMAVPDLIGRIARIVLWQMPVVVAAAIAAWWLLPSGWGELKTPVAVMLAAFVVTYPLRLFHAALQGLQDLAFVGGLQLTAWAAGTAVTVALVLAGWKLTALATGALVTQFVLYGGAATRMIVRFRTMLPRQLPGLARNEAVSFLTRGFWVSVGQFSHVLLYSTDVLIVAWFFGPVTVVPYACTQKLIAVLTNQPQVLAQVAAPALSELRIGATRAKLFSVSSSLSLALMLASGAVLVVVLAANRAFVSWWVGKDLYGGALLTALFGAAMLVRHWNTALVYSLFSFGHERRISLTMMADGVVTLIVSLVLARALGVLGVPLGFLSGALLVSVPANLLALSRETGVSPARFASTLTPWAARLVVLVLLAVCVNLLVRSVTFVSVAGIVLAMGTLYAAIMWPVAVRPPLGTYVRKGLAPVLRYLGLPVHATSPALAPTIPDHTSRRP